MSLTRLPDKRDHRDARQPREHHTVPDPQHSRPLSHGPPSRPRSGGPAPATGPRAVPAATSGGTASAAWRWGHRPPPRPPSAGARAERLQQPGLPRRGPPAARVPVAGDRPLVGPPPRDPISPQTAYVQPSISQAPAAWRRTPAGHRSLATSRWPGVDYQRPAIGQPGEEVGRVPGRLPRPASRQQQPERLRDDRGDLGGEVVALPGARALPMTRTRRACPSSRTRTSPGNSAARDTTETTSPGGRLPAGPRPAPPGSPGAQSRRPPHTPPQNRRPRLSRNQQAPPARRRPERTSHAK